MFWAVIMAGGSGERFWPKSRKAIPKQLLPITGMKTMIQLTVERLLPVASAERMIIITNRDQRLEMMKQLPEIQEKNIIAEPVGRDTAACIGLAAVLIQKQDPHAIMGVFPADHVIHPNDRFNECVKACADYISQNGGLMTCGIRPDRPATGYGYLHAVEGVSSSSLFTFMKVKQFVEKPDEIKAKAYFQRGEYFWNSGMFFWKVSTILDELKQKMPELADGLNAIRQGLGSKDLDKMLDDIYPNLPKISIDYGVMEHSENVCLCVAPFDWDDVGSWEAIGKHYSEDTNGNVCIGQVRLINCSNMLVYNLSHDEGLIATAMDLTDQIIIQTDDAVLVCPKKSAQKVKQMVDKLKQDQLQHFL
ncbi:MAG: mannose-1-phosphate guanylyltransferase [Candidatus Aureabacteria bacterium]|nr:mannose-1-phosphate guanylyltransferase [Candidatus Auribacterota bacterium]